MGTDWIRAQFNWEVLTSRGLNGEILAKCSNFEDAVVIANRYPKAYIHDRAAGTFLYRHEKVVVEYV